MEIGFRGPMDGPVGMTQFQTDNYESNTLVPGKMKFDLAQTIKMWKAHVTKINDILDSNKSKIDSGKSPEWMPCDAKANDSGCGEPNQQCATLTIGPGTNV